MKPARHLPPWDTLRAEDLASKAILGTGAWELGGCGRCFGRLWGVRWMRPALGLTPNTGERRFFFDLKRTSQDLDIRYEKCASGPTRGSSRKHF